MTSNQILEFMQYRNLDKVIDERYIYSLDLSLYAYEKVSLFERVIKQLFYIENSVELFNDNLLFSKYLETLFDTKGGVKFMNPKGFAFSEGKDRIVNNDFRVLIQDNTNKLNKEDLLYLATISSLIITGKLDLPIGYQEVNDYIRGKGEVLQEYASNGYLHIKIVPKTNMFTRIVSRPQFKIK